MCYDYKEKLNGVIMSIFQLLTKIKETNNSSEWAALLKEVGGSLYCCAYYILNDESLALDALQESYLAIQSHRVNFINLTKKKGIDIEIVDKKTKAWMLQIVRNKALNLLRTKKSQIKRDIKKGNSQMESEDPSNMFENKEVRDLVRSELAKLSPKYQNLLVFKFYHDSSNQEIAREIGCASQSVPVLIKRALETLKLRLEKVGFVVSIGVLSDIFADRAFCSETNLLIPPGVYSQPCPMFGQGSLIANFKTLKGIPMKAMIAIVLITVVSTAIYFTQAGAKDDNQTTEKHLVISIKEPLKDKSKNITSEISQNTATKSSVNEPIPLSDQKPEMPKQEIRKSLQNPTLIIESNDLSKVIENFKKTPYFKMIQDPNLKGDIDKLMSMEVLSKWLPTKDLKAEQFSEIIKFLLEFKGFFINAKHFAVQVNGESFLCEVSFEDANIAKQKVVEMMNFSKKVEKFNEKSNTDPDSNTASKNGNFDQLSSGYFMQLEERLVFTSKKGTFSDASSKSNFSLGGIQVILSSQGVGTHLGLIKIFQLFHVDISKGLSLNFDFNESGVVEQIVMTSSEANSPNMTLFEKATFPSIVNDSLNAGDAVGISFFKINIGSIISHWPEIKEIINSQQEGLVEQIDQMSQMFFQSDAKTLLRETIKGEILTIQTSSLSTTFVGIKNTEYPQKIVSLLQNAKLANTQNLQVINNQNIVYENKNLIIGESKKEFLKPLSDEEKNREYYFYQDATGETVRQTGKLLVQNMAPFFIDYRNENSSLSPLFYILQNEHLFDHFQNCQIAFYQKDKQIIGKQNSPFPFLFMIPLFSCSSLLNELNKEMVPNILEEKEKVVHESLGLSVLTGKVNVNGRTGKWVQKDFEGNLYSEVKYVDGKKEGEMFYFFQSGKLSHQIQYHENMREGAFIRNYENGNLHEKGNYFKDKKHGEWEGFGDNGLLVKKGSYDADKKTGVWKEYHGNGQLKNETEYLNGLPTKSVVSYNSEGHKMSEVILDKFGNGKYKVFDEDGKIKFEEEIGVYNTISSWKSYNKNGTIASEMIPNFENLQTAIIRNYDMNSQLIWEIPYMQGRITGIVKEYFADGKVKGNYQFAANLPTPFWKIYDSNGGLIGEWKADGQKTGACTDIKIFQRILKKIDNGYGTVFGEKQFTIAISATKVDIGTEIQDEKSFNGVSVDKESNNFGIDLKNLYRGVRISVIEDFYGISMSAVELKDSIRYQWLSWFNDFSSFIDDNCCYLLREDNIIKLRLEGEMVIDFDYKELNNRPF
jgi:RNA polymerase sigma factor (sigma-70 family)